MFNYLHLFTLKKYEILACLEFSSERKRMSIIVKEPDSNKIIMYTKGADSMIIPKLSKKTNPPELVRFNINQLKFFSKQVKFIIVIYTKGYRTLCIAQREIPAEEFKE